VKLKKFVDRTVFAEIGYNLKFTRCAHCGMRGMLILHGFIYGFDEYRNKRVIKARRVFCSNRNRRCGCGRTLTVWLSCFMRRTMIGTSFAWQFLQFILAGMSLEKAYNSIDPECLLSLSTFLRFFRRFKSGQHRIRSFIADHYTLSGSNDPSPVLETIQHLKAHLADDSFDPVSNFQRLSDSCFV
jgi:hypothetical protein